MTNKIIERDRRPEPTTLEVVICIALIFILGVFLSEMMKTPDHVDPAVEQVSNPVAEASPTNNPTPTIVAEPVTNEWMAATEKEDSKERELIVVRDVRVAVQMKK